MVNERRGSRFNQAVTIGAALSTLAGLATSVYLYVQGYAVSKGSDVNIVFDLKTFAEIDGSSSGALAVQNPLAEPLLCDQAVFNVVTFGSAFNMDGGQAANATTSGSNITDNKRIAAAGVYTLSGSLVRDSSGYPKAFQLDAAGGSNDFITFTSDTGTGHIISGSGAIQCRRLR